MSGQTGGHDIVYRKEPAPGTPAAPGEPAPAPNATQPHWQRSLVPDEVLLFRYSALTFNGHRIHYDRRHVTQTEGYPCLVVHGPLMATLMLDAFRDAHPGVTVRRFSFRALAAAFAGNALRCGGCPIGDGNARLWVRDAAGREHLAGEVSFACRLTRRTTRSHRPVRWP